MSDLTFKLTVATNVGKVRTNNEDNFIVCPDLNDSNWLIPRNTNNVLDLKDSGCLLVVADGMGGMNAGEVASEIAIESVKEMFLTSNISRIRGKARTIEKFIEKVIVTADKKIKCHVETNPQTSGMGTTIVLAWVVDGYAYIGWCGDSRAYCYNPERGLWRLSKDHSYVQQLVDSGKLDSDLAFDHPNSNIITRSLGDSSAKAKPDIVSYKLSEGDMLVLCSDGLCGLCRDEEIASVIDICNYSDIEDIKTSLISAALDAGGYDNVTVALFQCISTKKEILNSTVSNFERLSGQEQQPEPVPEGDGELFPMKENVEEEHSEEVEVSEDNEEKADGPMDTEAPGKEVKRRSHKGVWAVIIIMIILIAAGAAYYMYFK